MNTRIPKAVKKLVLPPPQAIKVEIHSIPEPPSMEDIRASQSRDSPPKSQEHSDSNMSLTGIEKDRLLQVNENYKSYKAQMKKKDEKIEDLERKLRQRSGLYLIHRDTIEEAEVEKCDAAVQVDMAETSGCQQEESICERCLMHEEKFNHLEQENQKLKSQMEKEAVDSEEEITMPHDAEVEAQAGRAGERINKLGRSYVNGRPLSERLRQDILRLADQGVSPIEISRTLKVTKGCISKTLKRLRKRRR